MRRLPPLVFVLSLLCVAAAATRKALCPQEEPVTCNADSEHHSCVCSMPQIDGYPPKQSCTNMVKAQELRFPVVTVEFELGESADQLDEFPENEFKEQIASALRVDEEDIIVLRVSCKGSNDELTVQFVILKEGERELAKASVAKKPVSQSRRRPAVASKDSEEDEEEEEEEEEEKDESRDESDDEKSEQKDDDSKDGDDDKKSSEDENSKGDDADKDESDEKDDSKGEEEDEKSDKSDDKDKSEDEDKSGDGDKSDDEDKKEEESKEDKSGDDDDDDSSKGDDSKSDDDDKGKDDKSKDESDDESEQDEEEEKPSSKKAKKPTKPTKKRPQKDDDDDSSDDGSNDDEDDEDEDGEKLVPYPYSERQMLDADSIATRIKAMGHLQQIAGLSVDNVDSDNELLPLEWEPNNDALLVQAVIFVGGIFFMLVLGCVFAKRFSNSAGAEYQDDLQKV